jgi:hypothetical protein
MTRRNERPRWERLLTEFAAPARTGPYDVTVAVGGPAGPFIVHVPVDEVCDVG